MKRSLPVFFFAFLISTVIYSQKHQSVYLECFGLGAIYSLNYDLRFTSLEKSNIGIRIGAEYFEAIFIVPVQVNYLLGKNGKFLEFGAGATIISGDIDFRYGTTGNEAIPTIWLGYRYQKINKGFTWRIGIASLTTGIPLWGGFSVGKISKKLLDKDISKCVKKIIFFPKNQIY